MEIIGNIVTDLKLEHTDKDVPYVKFRVAQDTFKTVDGERKQASSVFFNVTAWRALAEGITNTLSKGNPVVVVGHWDANDYKIDGEDRHAQWIVADAVGPDLRRIDATVTRRNSSKKAAKPAAEEIDPQTQDPFEE